MRPYSSPLLTRCAFGAPCMAGLYPAIGGARPGRGRDLCDARQRSRESPPGGRTRTRHVASNARSRLVWEAALIGPTAAQVTSARHVPRSRRRPGQPARPAVHLHAFPPRSPSRCPLAPIPASGRHGRRLPAGRLPPSSFPAQAVGIVAPCSSWSRRHGGRAGPVLDGSARAASRKSACSSAGSSPAHLRTNISGPWPSRSSPGPSLLSTVCGPLLDRRLHVVSRWPRAAAHTSRAWVQSSHPPLAKDKKQKDGNVHLRRSGSRRAYALRRVVGHVIDLITADSPTARGRCRGCCTSGPCRRGSVRSPRRLATTVLMAATLRRRLRRRVRRCAARAACLVRVAWLVLLVEAPAAFAVLGARNCPLSPRCGHHLLTRRPSSSWWPSTTASDGPLASGTAVAGAAAATGHWSRRCRPTGFIHRRAGRVGGVLSRVAATCLRPYVGNRRRLTSSISPSGPRPSSGSTSCSAAPGRRGRADAHCRELHDRGRAPRPACMVGARAGAARETSRRPSARCPRSTHSPTPAARRSPR